MFKICLFDLDDTLVRTEDLKDVREACKNNAEAKNLKAVKAGLEAHAGRHIYSPELLRKIRKNYPKLKLGVFTRSPRSYVKTVLPWAYPGFAWDIVVAYEDVDRTKPYGEGIDQAMAEFGVSYLNEVMLVGDADVDIRSAYNCGCIAVLDKSAWPKMKRWEHWKALELVADAIIDAPDELLAVLAEPDTFLPELERLLEGEEDRAGGPRFDKLGHFVPRELGGDKTSYPVYVCGRSFTNYESLKFRRRWHELTQSIEDHKEADEFSEHWIDAIRSFIAAEFRTFFAPSNVIVTAVPHRPGRKARLEVLLGQLQQSLAEKPIKKCNVTVAPGLLGFKDEVKSQHNDHLNHHQRFENVRDHLEVRSPGFLKGGKSVLVLDDVVTTGASLIYATIYLREAGASAVTCLAIAKSISDVI